MEAKIANFILENFRLYGYYLVFFFLLAENTFMLGLVIPGETVLLLSGFLASSGGMDITAIIGIASLAAILGNNAGYFIGREGGRRLIEGIGSRWLSPERIKAAEDYFDRHGDKTVFIGRFVAGVRTFVPVLAGASKMPYPKFLLYTVASVLLWTAGIGLLGYFFGENASVLLQIIKRAEVAILVLALLAVAYVLFRRFVMGAKRAGGK